MAFSQAHGRPPTGRRCPSPRQGRHRRGRRRLASKPVPSPSRRSPRSSRAASPCRRDGCRFAAITSQSSAPRQRSTGSAASVASPLAGRLGLQVARRCRSRSPRRPGSAARQPRRSAAPREASAGPAPRPRPVVVMLGDQVVAPDDADIGRTVAGAVQPCADRQFRCERSSLRQHLKVRRQQRRRRRCSSLGAGMLSQQRVHRRRARNRRATMGACDAPAAIPRRRRGAAP